MKFNNFDVQPFFCIQIGQFKLKRLAEGWDELHNLADNAAYYQIYVLYVLLTS